VRVIDWKNARNNDFVIANQVWVQGLLHKRRPDTIGFVNGLPLLLAEWKAPTKPLASAYDDNIRDYRDTIPQIFHGNGFVILSNGIDTVMGAAHARLTSTPHGRSWTRTGRKTSPRNAAARHLPAGALPRPDRELPAV
jgi:type I site-specific restriction-modification system R (restriction) subunit